MPFSHRHLTELVSIAALGALTLSGCASMSNKQKGAVIGAASGAAVGGLVGKHNGSTAKGAIIGAAVGGAAGAIIGHQMDQQAKELKQNIPGAVVERVGEGIQVTFASGLLFDFDSDRVRPEAGDNLRNLAAQGVERARITTRGLGESEPVGANESDAGRQKNRRIEVAIFASETARRQAERQTANR